MAGYSDTPLPKKLGIRAGFRIYLANEPKEVRSKLLAALTECNVTTEARGPIDLAVLFTESRAGLGRDFRQLRDLLTPAGMLWAAWPKKSSGVPTDLDEHEVREIGLRAGLVDVKVCAITETWSGLKFVRRVADRV